MRTSQFELRAAAVDPATPQSATLVTVAGEIDVTNVADFEARVARATGGGPALLDLSDVEYFDSSGFAALDRMLGGSRLTVVIAPRSVLARAASLLNVPFYESIEAARRPHPQDQGHPDPDLED